MATGNRVHLLTPTLSLHTFAALAKSLSSAGSPRSEQAKIDCGKAQFETIAAGAENLTEFVTVGAAGELLRRAAV